MNTFLIYGIIFVILLVLEFAYFKIADKFNIIDKPNERSSHSTIVLRGGGIIFAISALAWATANVLNVWNSSECSESVDPLTSYIPFLIGLFLVTGISFVDDIHSLPDSIRLIIQFVSYGLMFWSLGVFGLFASAGWLIGIVAVVVALIVCVGATNIINFMDGINGITAGYSLAVLVPLAVLNINLDSNLNPSAGFMDQSFLVTVILGILVFCIFNFRPKGKAKCFAGDVGSIGIAFIMLFAIGKLVMKTGDASYIIFLLVYGVDGCLTIMHRIMLHEHLGEAHRKHAFQLMANELKIGHVKVSLLYMAMQLVVSLGFIYLCPVLAESTGVGLVGWHWIYMGVAIVILAVAYVLFKKKYYHLHEEYLASLKAK